MQPFRALAPSRTLLRWALHGVLGTVMLPAVLALILLVSSVGTAQAHTFEQLKVIVNQLDGATLPNTVQRQKDMNDILKQCDKHGVHIRVTLVESKNNPQDPKDEDDNSIAPNGKIPDNAAHKNLEKNAEAGEIKNGGYKMWIAEEVKTQDKNGVTEVVNGGTYLNSPSSAIREQSGIDGDAQTWTHEMGHGLGLGHNDPGVDENNLMFEARRKADDTPAGTNLTKKQCEKMKESIGGLKPSTDKTEEQKKAAAPAKSTKHSMVDPVDSPPVQGTTADIETVDLVVDNNLINPLDNSLYVEIYLNATVGFVPATIYRVFLDLDNNAATGDAAGFDAVVEEHLMSTTSGHVTLLPLPGPGTPTILDPLAVEPLEFSGTGPTEGFEVPAGTSLSSRVSLSLLGTIANPIRVMVTSEDGSLTDSVGPESVTTVPPSEPTLSLSPTLTAAGGLVNVTGTDFTASSAYRILFDDSTVLSGLTSPVGDITAAFTVPPVPSSGDFLVDAIDADGLVQVAVLRILPIGGSVELLGQPESPADASESSSARDYTTPIAAAAAIAGALAIAAGGWYARRRWLR